MNVPPGARILAIQEPDVVYLADGDLHLQVGTLMAVVVPLRGNDILGRLERLMALIEAAGDALANDQARGRHYYDGG